MSSADQTFDPNDAPVATTAGFVVDWQIPLTVRIPRRPRMPMVPAAKPAGLTVIDRVGIDRVETRTAIFDVAQTIRGFARRFGHLAGTVEDDQLWRRQPAPPLTSTALQHTAYFADRLARTAVELTQLLSGRGRTGFGLGAGPETVSNALNPEMVLIVLAADAERVARMLEGALAGGTDRSGAAIIALAQQTVDEGVLHMGRAQVALRQAADPGPGIINRPPSSR